MRKIKSLVNQVRQFPEYLNAVDTLDTLIESDKRCVEACKAAYGNEFIKFYSKQPKSLQPSLTEIRIAGSKQASIMNETADVLSKFKLDFGELNVLNNEMQRSLMVARDAQNTAQKSQIAATKNPNDQNKQKAADDQRKAESIKSKSDNEIDDIRKRFICSLSDSLKKIADAQIKMAEQLGEIYNEFSTNAAALKEYKDAGITRLSQRLEQLDYELVD